MLPKAVIRFRVRRLSSRAPQPSDIRTLVAPQFIYVMKSLRKVVPPSRVILDDIWLSFYPGAKIGVDRKSVV